MHFESDFMNKKINDIVSQLVQLRRVGYKAHLKTSHIGQNGAQKREWIKINKGINRNLQNTC